MNNQTNKHLAALENKLQLLAQGQVIGLTPEEAAIYGVEDADIYDQALTQTWDDDFPDELEISDPFTTNF
ncbi:hypothetical protein [Mucilaginibacter jinjuensis]|uniref:Uncharacterized protein n=1 Tax=Mucilaginibacter jinjuensis TaxID=1176721 RepID=A0ABY7TCN1_9SPHI|nr:hypothetical protein [Mucilaginibacter jinjuensis]WCT13746.1 hypothetical protein PQO05_07335 [Mucilaginibacter jinjuensis]